MNILKQEAFFKSLHIETKIQYFKFKIESIDIFPILRKLKNNL